MLTATGKSNMEQVRDALTGITGVKVEAPIEQNAEWYMLVVRSNYHLDAVDGLRRQGLRAYWPSYERTEASKRMIAGRSVSRSVRFGILPYVLSQKESGIDMARAIERVSAIMDIVRTYSGNTLFLKDRDVDIVRRIQDGLNTPKPEASLHNFKNGQKVRFRDDLAHHWPPGQINKIAKESRIGVEVDMMGRKVTVTVFPHQIERI
jgi:transcription antitermination factor NusG